MPQRIVGIRELSSRCEGPQPLELLRDLWNGAAELRLCVVVRDEEAQPGGILCYRRIDDRLDIDAELDQRQREPDAKLRIAEHQRYHRRFLRTADDQPRLPREVPEQM